MGDNITDTELPPNKCQELEPGDIVVFLLTSDDPDGLAFFPLVDISPDVQSLYLTDKPWDGEQLVENGDESTLEVSKDGATHFS